MFNRFDIVMEAYYCYMAEYHNGQWSKEYALSGVFDRLRFKPCPNLSSDTLGENGKGILSALVSGETTLRDRRVWHRLLTEVDGTSTTHACWM